eukprot:jgi/Tetstr1/445351/TSEL_033149.t1
MSGGTALLARTIFDGDRLFPDSALLIEEGRVRAIVPVSEIPCDAERMDTQAALLCPGFVDWQVNGGGGVLFNETPTREGIRAIAAAHARFGTTTLLPTVITDAPEVSAAAAQAVAEAIADGDPAVVGVHFEGPHISLEKCGVHDRGFIRPLTREDHDRLARADLGTVVATVAPENASLEDIRTLSRAGVHVSLGHSNADFATANAAFRAGAQSVTHLFNAMSGLHHRDPGLAGAALSSAHVYCGLIPDGHHNGRLTIADGTLAGSDLDMMSGVRIMADACGAPFHDVLRMASRCPAQMLGLHDRGHLRPGARADILALDAERTLISVWIAGDRQER